MIPSRSEQARMRALDGLYEQLLTRGVRYFLPSSGFEIAGQARKFTPEIAFYAAGPKQLELEWLGVRYVATSRAGFSDHEQRMVRSIGRFLSTRYRLLFDRETHARNFPVFGGLTEDRYVSTFLEGRV